MDAAIRRSGDPGDRAARAAAGCARGGFLRGDSGWPLLAGKSDRPTLATRTIVFDYAPGPDELTPPAAFVEVPAEELQAALAGYGW